MLRRLSLTSSLILLLAACTPALATPIMLPTVTFLPDTPVPSAVILPEPTQIHPTPDIPTPTGLAEASPTPEFTLEPTIGETPQPVPTLIPVVTAASTAIPQPSAGSGAIQLYGPGPQSKIVSPLNIYGYAIPGFDDKGTVNLYGEDGRLLASQVLQLNTAYKWAYFYWPLPFNITSVGELGRLTMSTQDKYGRTTALYSVHVLLLPEGASIVYPPGDLRERCVIITPPVGQRLSGGVLTVTGKIMPFNNLPLTVALIGRDGSIANSQLVPITPSGADYVSFRVDIQYSLSRGTWELLTVTQFDDRIGGLMYLYSQEIFLNP